MFNPQDSPSIDSGGTVNSPGRDDDDTANLKDARGGQPSCSPLQTSWRQDPLSETERNKVHQILEACRDYDYSSLAALATSEGGLVEDEVRRVAWPLLLGSNIGNAGADDDWRSLERHRDEDQVKLDVNRSFVYYPINEDEKRLDRRKNELSNVITEVLRRHPILSYFQGYHDIVQVLLLVLGEDAAVTAVAHLSLLRIRDFMLPTMSGAISHLHLLPSILYAADPVLAKHLSLIEPFFALAATLTLYAHDIQDYGDIARLFDFLLAREAVLSVYLFATVVLSRRDELLDIDADEPDMLHAVLSKLPKPLDLDALISRSTFLFSQHPPQSLPFRAWSRISSNSVLKTTRDPKQVAEQSLEQGERFFSRQAEEIQTQESRKRMREYALRIVRKYKQPIRTASVALAVALLALYLRRHTSTSAGTGITASLASVLVGIRQSLPEALQRFLSRLW